MFFTRSLSIEEMLTRAPLASNMFQSSDLNEDRNNESWSMEDNI